MLWLWQAQRKTSAGIALISFKAVKRQKKTVRKMRDLNKGGNRRPWQTRHTLRSTWEQSCGCDMSLSPSHLIRRGTLYQLFPSWSCMRVLSHLQKVLSIFSKCMPHEKNEQTHTMSRGGQTWECKMRWLSERCMTGGSVGVTQISCSRSYSLLNPVKQGGQR